MRSFQRRRGLRVDGLCGPQTWSVLVEAGLRLGDRLLYHRRPMMRGDDVADLQRSLGRLGFDAGRVDGIFGERTAVALAEFQRNFGLGADGVCGTSTVEALRRLGSPRTEEDQVGLVRERETLRRRSITGVEGRRVGLGQTGGLDAALDSVARSLKRGGADAVLLWDPDGSAQAAQANAMGADVFLAFTLNPEVAGCTTAYYSGYRYESPGGRRLAGLLQSAISGQLDLADLGCSGMSLPVLRETRMPAVLCELGPPSVIVERMASLGPIVLTTLVEWCTSPCD